MSSNSLADLVVPPVEVGLLVEMVVEVVLTGSGSRVHAGPPKLDTQLLGAEPSALGSDQTYHDRRGASVDDRDSRNHGCSVAGVVGDQVHQHSDAPAPSLGDEPVQVLGRAQVGLDGPVVAHVVAPVGVGRHGHRTEPDPVHPQPLQVVEVVDDATQVTGAVAVGVGEGAGVDLIEDTGPPPRPPLRGGPGAVVLGHVRTRRRGAKDSCPGGDSGRPPRPGSPRSSRDGPARGTPGRSAAGGWRAA